MYRKTQSFIFNKVIKLTTQQFFYNYSKQSGETNISIGDEVMLAINSKRPIVALESTIITHGMPFPDNLNCALEVESIVRAQAAIPATIGILGGKVKVGLTKQEIEQLAQSKNVVKVSRRDFGHVISNKKDGGTTVAGTLVVAKKVNIPIFATGGIGGVHREAESSFDISADLIELGRSPVAVVSSGVKSILDIPKTLEYLETQGVLVSSFGNSTEFPAFYSRLSGYSAPYNVKDEVEAANLLKSHLDMNLGSGLLIAVPVPEKYAINEEEIETAIKAALNDASEKGIKGKLITPFLLERIAMITKGRSLIANVALIKNNARVAADIAVQYNKLNRDSDGDGFAVNGGQTKVTKGPVIVGGSVVDCCATLKGTELMVDGRTHKAKFHISAGGVGRNICEALGKLGTTLTFISAVGDDDRGDFLLSSIDKNSRLYVPKLKNQRTSQFIVVLDNKGECKLLLGDGDIHKLITPKMVKDAENIIEESPLIVFDGNLSKETVSALLCLAEKHNIPVLFEPTDVPTAVVPFQTPFWRKIDIITPNLNELKEIAKCLGLVKHYSSCKINDISACANLALAVANKINTVILTLSENGLIVARKGKSTEPLINLSSNKATLPIARHYPALSVKDVVNVSGAGDCLASGIINGLIKGYSEKECIANGLYAAYDSLKSESAIPQKFSNISNQKYSIKHTSIY